MSGLNNLLESFSQTGICSPESDEDDNEDVDLDAQFSSEASSESEWQELFPEKHSIQLGDDFDDFMQKKCLALNLKHHCLTTGCPNIDSFLNGGIPRSGLTEFVGPSAVGKTQIALQLSITAQLPEEQGGLHSGVIYINTEVFFPSARLVELCKHFKTRFGSSLPDNPMDNILIKNVYNTEALLHCLRFDLPSALEDKKIGLLIVDSIAATFRSEYGDDNTDTTMRAKDLKFIGRSLHDLAFNHNLVLVCLNQVGASMSLEAVESQDFAPSLGVGWRNFVNNRIVVSRKDDERMLQVPFSCYIPVRSMSFELGAEGISSTDTSFDNAK